MDQIATQSRTTKCIKHSSKKIKFVQVNDVSNSYENNHLFYCTTCINKDLTFKGINYLLISQIIYEGQQNIIQKWPPVNDYSVIDKLIQHTEEQTSSSSVINQINRYFTQLKEEFLRKVDLCEKKMINHALELPLGKESILKQYQDISQIDKLRSLLIDGVIKDNEVFQQNYRQFMREIESKKEQNSELLSKLLYQCNQKQQLVNFEYPNQIKDSIFSFIDQIDFFNNSNLNSNNSQSRNQSSQGSNASKIMKLISNKSNFCTKDFLSQLQVLLEKINPLLSQISFENMHEHNKSSLDFSALSEQKFNLVQNWIEHQIQIEKNREFVQGIKATTEYKYLEKIIDSNVNFVNSNLKEQLKQQFTDTYPLLKLMNFTNAISDNDKFDTFRSLTEIEIEDMFTLIQKRKTLAQDNQYNSSQSKQIKDWIQNDLKGFENLDQIFRRYPIFDLAKKKKEIQKQPLDIKLMKTNYNGGNQIIDIYQDNTISLKQNVNMFSSLNCVSDIILEKQKKYIFRFSILNYNSHFFYIGLMSNSKSDVMSGLNNFLSCHFQTKNNVIQQCGGSIGIDKHEKGDKLTLSKENVIEMRVWLGNKQLEILDFPHYQYKVELQDKYKSSLIEQNDLKLYIGMQQTGLKIVLDNAIEVDTFPN